MSESNNKSKIRYELDFSGNVIGEKEAVNMDKAMNLPETSFNHLICAEYDDYRDTLHAGIALLCTKCNEKILPDYWITICDKSFRYSNFCRKCKADIHIMNCPYRYYDSKKDCIMVCCGLVVLNADLDDKIRYENAKCSENHELKTCKLCYKDAYISNNNGRIDRLRSNTDYAENVIYNLINSVEDEWCDHCKKIVNYVYNTSKTNYIDIKKEAYLSKHGITQSDLLLGIKGLCQKIKMLEEMIEFAPGEEQMLQAQKRFETSVISNDNNK